MYLLISMVSYMPVLVSCGLCNNFHKCDSLKQQRFIPSQFWKPEAQNQYHWLKNKVSSGLCTFDRLYRRTCSLLIPAAGGCQHSLICDYIAPVFKASIFHLFAPFSHCLFLYVCMSVSSLSLTMTLVIVFRTDLENPW